MLRNLFTDHRTHSGEAVSWDDLTKPRAVDWGKCGGVDPASGDDKTVIVLTPGVGEKAAAKVADAIRYLQAEYPGAVIHVRGLDGQTVQRIEP